MRMIKACTGLGAGGVAVTLASVAGLQHFDGGRQQRSRQVAFPLADALRSLERPLQGAINLRTRLRSTHTPSCQLYS
jgi:hypothetical protein